MQVGDEPSKEGTPLTLSSRPCCLSLDTVTAVESMEDWVLLMKDRWCVLEVRAKVDARYIEQSIIL